MSSAPYNYNYIFKYIIIGDMGVGKSCILHQFTDKKYASSANTEQTKTTNCFVGEERADEKEASILSSAYCGFRGPYWPSWFQIVTVAPDSMLRISMKIGTNYNNE
uniref:Uncharacterized protein n=1 Tax=Glossina pallidipes TaxID=7398 RepID=A0A1A9ZDU7_GLOPL